MVEGKVTAGAGEAGSEFLHADHDLFCGASGFGEHAQLYGDVVHVADDPECGDFAVAVFVDVDAVEFELFAGGGDAGRVDGALVVAVAFHQ
ncbi:hypothetical protein [Rhodococcus jostii]|uniref:Uncharacterized protein n=1 Tax=Rhodococcus jostii TaxID=132919 RepID=A0ABU4C6U4_RHOJO|nr:hypothetical protein [Rhodococcus jostii]MDV6279153.1 hypothetical protein [Rhodococcus jostii]